MVHYEGGERVGELFRQSFAVILRKRGSSPTKECSDYCGSDYCGSN